MDVVDNSLLFNTQRNRKKFAGGSTEFDDEICPTLSADIEKEVAAFAANRDDRGTSETLENLAELKECSDAKAQHYKFPNQDLMEDEAPRIGQRMDHEEFINKLREAGIQCWYNAVPVRGMVGIRAIRRGYERLGLQYICAVKLGRTTEYDTFHFDAHGLPLNKKTIGWRSVLIQLIAKGIITEEEAHQIFGEPTLHRVSTLYRKALYDIRNTRA